MSGRGQKRQLKQMMSNLHQMLGLLGQNDGSKLVIKIDQFQHLRRDFIKAAEQYEADTNNLPNTSDKKQRGLTLYRLSSNKTIMDNSIKQMMNICLKMNQKLKANQSKTKKKKIKLQQSENSQQNQLQYKNLTLYQLQNTYFRLTKKQHKDVARANNQNYPEQLTLEELKLRKPIKRGFSEQTDPQSEQYIKQKQLLQAIKHIDARIEEKMDYILDGLRTLNYNAVTISQSIGVVHNKILVNVQKINDNLDKLQEAEKLLQEAAPLVSKPNCIMNLIILALLGVLVYFLIKKLFP